MWPSKCNVSVDAWRYLTNFNSIAVDNSERGQEEVADCPAELFVAYFNMNGHKHSSVRTSLLSSSWTLKTERHL